MTYIGSDGSRWLISDPGLPAVELAETPNMAERELYERLYGQSFYRVVCDPDTGVRTGLEWLDPRSVSCNPDGSHTVDGSR